MVLAVRKAVQLRTSLGYRGVRLVKSLILDQFIYFVL